MFKQLIIDLKSLIGEIDRLVRNEFHVVTSKELTEMLSILKYPIIIFILYTNLAGFHNIYILLCI